MPPAAQEDREPRKACREGCACCKICLQCAAPAHHLHRSDYPTTIALQTHQLHARITELMLWQIASLGCSAIAIILAMLIVAKGIL